MCSARQGLRTSLTTVSILDLTNVEDVAHQLAGGTGPVVVVPVYNAFHDVLACVESIFRNTSEDVPVLIVDDAGGDSRAFESVRTTSQHTSRQVLILHHATNSGFVGSCNDAFEAAGTRDVVLVNSDVIVGPQWLERLHDAAYSSNVIATASSLTNHGTLLSVPQLYRPSPQLPGNHTPDTAAEVVAQWSRRTRPTIPTAVGHCVYIKRRALDLVGGFDTIFGRGYGEEVDFSQRCVAMGLRHVCADDVFTFHRGGGSFGSELTSQQAENERIVQGRHPWYSTWVQTVERDAYNSLTAALVRAAISLRGMSIAVDGRALGPDLMGTQQVIIETVRTLVQHELVSRVVVYVSGPVPQYALDRLRNSPVEFVRVSDPHSLQAEPCDIAYRPYQAWGTADVEFLRKIGRWTSINQLDCIAYGNPSYFANAREWQIYRATTRSALSGVDGVAYLSHFSMSEAAAEDLVPCGTPEQVVFTGAQFDQIQESSRPHAMKNVDGPFLFVVGVSYLHKNRPFAVEVLNALRARGWNGKLVLAGLNPPAGSSNGPEAKLFLHSPELREHVVVLPGISEAEKRWLFENAALMLYPTTVEGFGLVPFEAAQYGLATLSTRQGSLDEVLPRDIPTIDSFDVAHTSELVKRVLDDEGMRRQIASSLLAKSAEFTAERTTALLIELFLKMIDKPPRRTVALVGEDGLVQSWHSGLVTMTHGDRVVPPGIIVRLGWRFRRAKTFISPPGSRRQDWIRRFSNKVRTLLRK